MKRADLVVFAGPSLSAREVRAIAPCRVLPPARQGDLWRAMELRPRAIAPNKPRPTTSFNNGHDFFGFAVLALGMFGG